MPGTDSRGSKFIPVIAAVLLLMLGFNLSGGATCANAHARCKRYWEKPTLTPNPDHAHFTPTPTKPSMREQKEALASETDQAIAEFTQAIEDDPTDVGAYSDRGEAYAQQGELEKAIADFTKALELDSDLVAVYNSGARPTATCASSTKQ